MLRAPLLVLVLGCGSKAPPVTPPPPAPDCTAAVAASGRFVTEGATPAGELERVKGVVALRCVEDQWPAPATSCIAAAANLDAAHACIREHLTVAQHERLMRDLQRTPEVAAQPDARYFLNLCLSLRAEGKFSEALVACDAGMKNEPSPETRRKLEDLLQRIRDDAKGQGVKVAP